MKRITFSSTVLFLILPDLSPGQWITRCTWRTLMTHSYNFFFSGNPNYKKYNSDCSSVCSYTGIYYWNSDFQYHCHWQAWRWDPFPVLWNALTEFIFLFYAHNPLLWSLISSHLWSISPTFFTSLPWVSLCCGSQPWPASCWIKLQPRQNQRAYLSPSSLRRSPLVRWTLRMCWKD